MTNLIEKSLITGFGIFSLIIFIIMISPFIQKLEDHKEENEEDDELDIYQNFINKVHNAIINFIKNPGTELIEEVKYPENINITFIDNYVKFEFIIANEIQYKFLSYSDYFIQKYYFNISPNVYLLNITQCSSLINVELQNI